MIKKSITISPQQQEWLNAQLDSGAYGNESEVFRDLIRERQQREQDREEAKERLLALLQEGEASGVSSRTPEEIRQAARNELRRHGQV